MTLCPSHQRLKSGRRARQELLDTTRDLGAVLLLTYRIPEIRGAALEIEADPLEFLFDEDLLILLLLCGN